MSKTSKQFRLPDGVEIAAGIAAGKERRFRLRALFIRRLAEYMGGPNQVGKSILLQMGKPEAKEWAELRNLTPLFGYPTVDEAEQVLMDFLKS
jgi:hypothetical protein